MYLPPSLFPAKMERRLQAEGTSYSPHLGLVYQAHSRTSVGVPGQLSGPYWVPWTSLLCTYSFSLIMAQLVKNPPVIQETLKRSPGEAKGYPFQYCGLENSMGSQRVRHDWASCTFIMIYLGCTAWNSSTTCSRSICPHHSHPPVLTIKEPVSQVHGPLSSHVLLGGAGHTSMALRGCARTSSVTSIVSNRLWPYGL